MSPEEKLTVRSGFWLCTEEWERECNKSLIYIQNTQTLMVPSTDFREHKPHLLKTFLSIFAPTQLIIVWPSHYVWWCIVCMYNVLYNVLCSQPNSTSFVFLNSFSFWIFKRVTIIFSQSATNKTSNIFTMTFLSLPFYIFESTNCQIPRQITQPYNFFLTVTISTAFI